MATGSESRGSVALELVYEAVRCKHRIEHEQNTIAELRKIAADELGCDPKAFNAYLASFLGGA